MDATHVFSPATKYFYAIAQKPAYDAAGSWPADGVEVDSDTVTALLEAERNGKQIVSGPNGLPIAVDRVFSAEEKSAQLRAARDGALSRTDWLVQRQIECSTLPTDQYAELLAYRQALRNITSQPGFPDVMLPAAPDFIA